MPFLLVAQSDSVSFSFTLPERVMTSAGVFAQDGTLIRTLWNGLQLDPGTYARAWDGIDDEGRLASPTTYQVKVLTNQVTYTWDGVVGNSSDTFIGPQSYQGFRFINALCLVDSKIYYARGYNERQPTFGSFQLSNPHLSHKININNNGYGQEAHHVCSDGTRVYYGGFDPYEKAGPPGTETVHFVVGLTTSNERTVNFPAGANYTNPIWGVNYRTIDKLVSQNGHISGMVVQQKGGYLFVSHRGLNELHVLDKISGALVRTVSLVGAGLLTLQSDADLWVQAGSTLRRYTVNSDGTLTSGTVSIGGLVQPLGLAVTADGAILAVVDGGSSQQVKAYRTSNGAASWTLGQAGGYLTNSTVMDTKFCFSKVSASSECGIGFEPDGSFWLVDYFNNRVLKFSADRSRVVDKLSYGVSSRSIAVDVNNPSRVFADYLEYRVDYTKPLGGRNGSWSLVKNWGAALTASEVNEYHAIRNVATLSNNHTYGITYMPKGQIHLVFELVEGGTFRYTGQYFPRNDNVTLQGIGNLVYLGQYLLNGITVDYRNKILTGFDISSNPVWSEFTTTNTLKNVSGDDPFMRSFLGWGHTPVEASTSTGVLISHELGVTNPNFRSTKWHLGAIKNNKWLWKAAQNTDPSYSGPYPTNGDIDYGNGVEYGGGPVVVKNRHIIWGYHGEFWKQSQTNKWTHLYDNGLLVGIFGVTGPEVQGQEAPPGMAGNALSANLVEVNGDLYLYHCDESYHGGVHRWKISGLASIREQVIPITLQAMNELNLVYPNPVQGFLQVSHSIARNGSLLEIISVDGRKIKTYVPLMGNNATSIDVRFLPVGSYILQFSNGTSSTVTRFIKL